MTSRQPPRPATWVFGGLATDEYGDHNRLRQRRTQTRPVIATGSCGGLEHDSHLARAKCAVQKVSAEICIGFCGISSGLQDFYVIFPMDGISAPDHLISIWFVGASIRVLLFAISDWVAAHLHSASPRTAVLILATALIWRFPWLQLRVLTLAGGGAKRRRAKKRDAKCPLSGVQAWNPTGRSWHR